MMGRSPPHEVEVGKSPWKQCPRHYHPWGCDIISTALDPNPIRPIPESGDSFGVLNCSMQSLVNCPTRWSLYCHLHFCIYHFQIQILPRKCKALLTAPIQLVPYSQLVPPVNSSSSSWGVVDDYEFAEMYKLSSQSTGWCCKKLFCAPHLFLSSLGWAEENILVPDCYTLIHYVQCSGLQEDTLSRDYNVKCFK